jgi:hypothetical protein
MRLAIQIIRRSLAIAMLKTSFTGFWTSSSRAKLLSIGMECQPGSAKHYLKSNVRVNPCICVRYLRALNSKLTAF